MSRGPTTQLVPIAREVEHEYRLEWGPIPREDGLTLGALGGVCSILVRPPDSHQQWVSGLMERVRALIPDVLLPDRSQDDAEALVKRLAASDFLDDIHVLKGGKGPRRVQLNATHYPQPRRVTWSEEGCSEEPAPEGFVWLYAYTQVYREPEDWCCRVMPPEVKELKNYVWRLARATGILSRECSLSEPTACQLMMYYTALELRVGRHRDNFFTEHLLQYLDGVDVLQPDNWGPNTSASGDQNSQVVGSDVLIWTDGNADMFLKLSFPDPANPSGNRDTYNIHPIFCIPMSSGTLLIFKAIDDLLFCHEAGFDDFSLKFYGALGYRFAYVFRWLQSARMFSVEPPYKMVLPEELKAKQATHRAEQARKRARRDKWHPAYG